MSTSADDFWVESLYIYCDNSSNAYDIELIFVSNGERQKLDARDFLDGHDNHVYSYVAKLIKMAEEGQLKNVRATTL